jgi:Flp pilus assembly pilin Flp
VLRAIRALLHNDLGQDLAEYCLLTALLALIALGILYHVSGGMQGLWNTAGTTIQAGSTATSGGAQQSGAPANSQ